MSSIYSSGLVIAVGTYDGVLAGWEFVEQTKSNRNTSNIRPLTLSFATAVHEGSVRSLSIAGNADKDEPGALLSCGYDETLKTHDWNKRQTSSGEVRTPVGFGTPICSAFAPPSSHSTHCVVGFSCSNKICIYKKRDWSVHHVLPGHDGGIGAMAVHPTGKLALSGGVIDGKLKLWDLTKGRLSFVNKINPASIRAGSARYDTITSVIWSEGGDFYAFSHGSRVTVREVSTGKTQLDVEMPSRINQLALMSGPEGLFVAVACNDGSLPVLAVEDSEEKSRKAIMAIEPVDTHLAREERFKCIQSVQEYYVVTANSAGVVSLMNLQGAINMMMSENNDEAKNSSPENNDRLKQEGDGDKDRELAVDIVESVQLGTGARITCLATWCKSKESQIEETSPDLIRYMKKKKKLVEEQPNKRKLESNTGKVLSADAVKKARLLIKNAKKLKIKRVKKIKK